MDTKLLVRGRIKDGGRLITAMAEQGVPIVAAFWVKPHDSLCWNLYIASPSADAEGRSKVHALMVACWRQIPDAVFGVSEVRIAPPSRPIVEAVIKRQKDERVALPIYLRSKQQLGDIFVDRAYIYPVPKPKERVAEGKAAVLRFLEACPPRSDDSPKEYSLERDADGGLVAVIAGHRFVSTEAPPASPTT